MRSTMRKKLLWLIIGSLVVLAMVLISCGPATTTTTTQQPTTTTQPTVTTTTTTQPTTATTTETETTGPTLLSPETPKYGGVFTRAYLADPNQFDEYWNIDWVMSYYTDTLVQGDWTKGPAGTNEYNWSETGMPLPFAMTGGLAESWDYPDPKTIILHLRKGVRWALNPDSEASRLVNGREFVADDVIKDWERDWTNPASKQSTTVPRAGIAEVYAADKYTVVLRWKSDPEPGREFETRLGWGIQLIVWHLKIMPWEVAKKYGDYRDWRNAVGTGPYMLVDYVPGSMITFKRNPNYWEFDPYHPENRLPYVETSRTAIIPDASTRQAALRTGKVDHIWDVGRDDARRLIQTNPELGWVRYLSSAVGGGVLAFKANKPDQPWYKQEVRQALTMAIDYPGIVNGIFGGEAVYPATPIAPRKVYIEMGAYVPLDKLPADIQELFTYNVAKAKQMLADAGYPNGFKASIVGTAETADQMQMVKAYWKDVGVDLDIQIKERAVFASIQTQHTFPELLFGAGSGTYPTNLMNYLPTDWHNYSDYTGPEMSPKALELDEVYFDEKEVGRVFSEFTPHLYRLALYVGMPIGYGFGFWQPWVQNYHGEIQVGNSSVPNFVKYIWVDMDLKKSLGK